MVGDSEVILGHFRQKVGQMLINPLRTTNLEMR